MKLRSYPNCCNAFVLCDFGQTMLSAFDDGMLRLQSREDLKSELENYINDNGDKMLTAITNDEQKEANKVLLEFGFKHSKWMEKNQHPETKIRLWWREPEVWEYEEDEHHTNW